MAADPNVGQLLGTQQELSNWAGPYVTSMLGQGAAIANAPYQAYTGPLTAGESGLQTQAFQGLGSLAMPESTMGAYAPTSFTTPGVAQQYMDPYMEGAIAPQIAEAKRQAEIQRVQNAGRMTKAGAYGGDRQAILEAEGDRNLATGIAGIYGTGMEKAYQSGMGQFNTEEQRRQAAQDQTNQYGFNVANAQQAAGATQRAIEGEGIAADYSQFQTERDAPYKNTQFMQSLLQGLPLSTTSASYSTPSAIGQAAGAAEGARTVMDLFSGWGTPTTNGAGGSYAPNYNSATNPYTAPASTIGTAPTGIAGINVNTGLKP